MPDNHTIRELASQEMKNAAGFPLAASSLRDCSSMIADAQALTDNAEHPEMPDLFCVLFNCSVGRELATARFPPFDHLAYSEAERDKKTPEVYQ